MTDKQQQQDDPECWMMPRCNLFGQVGMILCWYWDSDLEDDYKDAIRGVAMIPQLLRGETEDFDGDDWWLFYDALGMYPHRNEALDELYAIASEGIEGKLAGKRTKAFWPPDDEDEFDDEDEVDVVDDVDTSV